MGQASCPPAHTPEPGCLLPELIEEELYLEAGRGAGGGPLPRPPMGRLRLSSPRVGGSRSPGPARLGSSLFSDSVSEAVDGSELGPAGHRWIQNCSPPPISTPSCHQRSCCHSTHHRQDRLSSGPDPGPRSCPHRSESCAGRRSSHQWCSPPCHCSRCRAHRQEDGSPVQSAEAVRQSAASLSEAAPPPVGAEDGCRQRDVTAGRESYPNSW